LSVGQGGSSANLLSSQIVAQPAVAIAPLFGVGAPTGLSPAQIQTAYGVNGINFGKVSGTGAGQTIAVVDAYFDPNISSDLAKFDAQYNLPAAPSFTQYVENGLSWNNSGWALETALDVEWAHAIAPAANIVLVEAQPNLTDLFSAVSFAANLANVSVVSMSWGASEFSGEAAYNNVFTTPVGHNGVTFVASSGDSGTTLFPSASPNVLSVGGTTLNVTKPLGTYVSETGWSGSGTGSSPYETATSSQSAVTGLSARTTPDVAFDANPSTGVSVYDSVPYGRQSGWFTVGGTSVGAPSWAGLIAIADQGRPSNQSLTNAQLSQGLYTQLTNSDFHNSSGPAGSSSPPTYGLVIGLGSPVANALIPALDAKFNTTTPIATSVTTTVTVAARVSKPVGGRLTVDPPSPTNPTNPGSGGSSSTSTSTTSGISITALNPSLTSATVSLTPIFLVPPPLPPIVIHLGASTSPVTAQAVSSTLTSQEQPTSITHFGQSVETELQTPFKPQLGPKTEAPPLIDVIEPFQPLGPENVRKDEPAVGPGAASRAWRSRLLSEPRIDTVLELTDRSLLPGPIGGSSTSAKDRGNGARPSSGFFALFGAAAVVAGGYHLALRESERFKSRGVPRCAGIKSK